MNSTPEERGCQAPNGSKEVPPLKEKMEAGLTTSDLNAVISEVSGKRPQLQDLSPKPLPPSDPNSTEANFPNWSKDPFVTKGPPISKVIEVCNQPNETPAKKKAIEDSRKLIESFAQNLKNYPKHLSYEGSVVLCVMVSINETESISINGLPSVDRELIISQLPEGALKRLQEFKAHLKVEFDEARDFILTYTPEDSDRGVTLRFFNTVIHPQTIDKAVAVEKDGEKISLGGKFQFDKRSIQRKIGLTDKHETDDDTDDGLPPRRQPIAGRNAYEIRADVLQMAIDWGVRNNQAVKTPDDVVSLAKKFYSFVEDRNRR